MESKEVLVANSTLEYFFGDLSFHEECLKSTIHEDHPFLSTEFDHRVDLVRCSVDDERADRIVVEEYFTRCNASFASLARQENLAHDPEERHRKLYANLWLL